MILIPWLATRLSSRAPGQIREPPATSLAFGSCWRARQHRTLGNGLPTSEVSAARCHISEQTDLHIAELLGELNPLKAFTDFVVPKWQRRVVLTIGRFRGVGRRFHRVWGFARLLAPDPEAPRAPGSLPIRGSLARIRLQARSAASSKSGASTGRTCQPVTFFPST